MNELSHPGNWFAVQVRPRAEASVGAYLSGKGYPYFLPTYSRKAAGRSQHTRLPLFPGYLFCRLHSEVNARIVTTPGIIRLVGYGKLPTPIDENEIAAIQTLVESGVPATPWPQLEPGDTVRITNGPLCGLEGVLSEVDRGRRLLVSVNLLQRAALVQLEPHWVTRTIKRSSIASSPSVGLHVQAARSN